MELLNTYEKQIIELLLQSDKTLPEISAGIGISKPATSKYLKKLEEEYIVKGVYERNTVGRTIKYSLQPFHLVFSIDPKDASIIGFKAHEPMDTDYLSLGYVQQKEFREEVKQYLTEINNVGFDSYMILLYGSVAQGTAHRKSDIDFLLVKEQWSKQEKDQVLEKIAIASNSCLHQAKPFFTTLEEFEDMDASLQKQIKEHGVILYEKDSQWGRIKRQLQRYRSITI